MELDDFINKISGEPLTEQQLEYLNQAKTTPTGRNSRVVVIGSRFNWGTSISNLLHQDFNRLEEQVLAKLLSDAKQQRQLEKTILFGHRFTYGWFDEFESMIKTRDIPIREVFDWTKPEHPSDHPTRKREPKGPRGKWGKLK